MCAAPAVLCAAGGKLVDLLCSFAEVPQLCTYRLKVTSITLLLGFVYEDCWILV